MNLSEFNDFWKTVKNEHGENAYQRFLVKDKFADNFRDPVNNLDVLFTALANSDNIKLKELLKNENNTK